MSSSYSSLIAFCLTFVWMHQALANAPSAEQVEFFEKQIRPLMVQHCHECHGAKKQEGGLRLDTHAGFLRGADGGPVFINGNVNGSHFFQVILYPESGTQMPPKGKLPEEQIALIRQWLEMGAPWPTESAATDPSTAATPHWAFQSVVRPAIPPIEDPALRSPVDSFITAALREKHLSLSEPASAETFIRRATFDLWGIPPTFEAVREFAEDKSPDACERLLDRLLASPLYGQRWARHWLDIARYADSKGYVFTEEPRYPYAYTYRDYVVDAFNADMPFHQFITEQLAADVIVDAEKPNVQPDQPHDPRLAALGFLTVGRRYLNNPHDIIDDRIDVVSRGLLGLTVGCARCHDHKFDPISTADYYSLYGIFQSTSEPQELPVIGLPKSLEAYQAFQTELAKRQADVTKYEMESVPKLMAEIRNVAGDSFQMIAKRQPAWANTALALKGANEPRGEVVDRWSNYLNQTAAQPHPILGPWHQLAKVGKVEDFPTEVNRLVESWTQEAEAAKVNAKVRQIITEHKPATLIDLAKAYGKLFDDIDAEWVAILKATPDAKSLPDAVAEEIRQILYAPSSPAFVTLDQAQHIFPGDVRNKVTDLKRKADSLRVTSPGAPPRAMIVKDGPVHEPVIFIRGNPGRPGKQVPRQFLQAVSHQDDKPFTKGSGRLELAEKIVDPRNPLSHRVFVNRIWQHHFGTGIVPTPSDFGTRGLPPSEPQLLDWFASEMTGSGADGSISASPNRMTIKRLHRLIMASAVFRQSSAENPVARGIDPENRLLWRMPRQRLDFESYRDSLLAVSGKLDDSLGGQPFDGVMNPNTTRRTIYAFINRNDLPGIFRTFDFADTDSTAAERPQTTVPQQSLFAMNSPFVQEQARRLSAICQNAASTEPERVRILYQQTFARQPTADEQHLALRFLAEAQTSPTDKLTPWDRLTQVLMMTNDFCFFD